MEELPVYYLLLFIQVVIASHVLLLLLELKRS